MGLSGDSLTVFIGVAGIAGGALIAAVPSQAMRSRIALLAIGGALVVFLAVWWFHPAAIPAQPALAAMWGITPIACVLLAIAARRPPPACPVERVIVSPGKITEPEHPFKASVASKWTPDITLLELGAYMTLRTVWAWAFERNNYGATPTPDDVGTELMLALYQGRVTAWGRAHPDEEEVQVDRVYWYQAQFNFKDSSAFLADAKATAYCVRVSGSEVRLAWPEFQKSS